MRLILLPLTVILLVPKHCFQPTPTARASRWNKLLELFYFHAARSCTSAAITTQPTFSTYNHGLTHLGCRKYLGKSNLRTTVNVSAVDGWHFKYLQPLPSLGNANCSNFKTGPLFQA